MALGATWGSSIVDQRKHDRTDEARKRIDAGKKTLTAILEGNTDAIRQQVSEHAGKGEVVGKLTQVIGEVAPVLQENTGAVKTALGKLDAAANELAQHGAEITNVADRVEQAVGTLITSTNLPADVLPKNLVSDLVADAIEDTVPQAEPVDDQPPTAPPTSAASSTTPSKKKKKRRERRQDANGDAKRPSIKELARGSGILESFRTPSRR